MLKVDHSYVKDALLGIPVDVSVFVFDIGEKINPPDPDTGYVDPLFKHLDTYLRRNLAYPYFYAVHENGSLTKSNTGIEYKAVCPFTVGEKDMELLKTTLQKIVIEYNAIKGKKN